MTIGAEAGVTMNFSEALDHAFSQHEAGAEPDWLITARQHAFVQFQELGLPGRKNEEWKYTNIHKFLKHSYTPLPAPEQMVLSRALPFQNCKNGLWFINGYLQKQTISDENLSVKSLQNGDADGELEQAFNSLKNAEKDAFVLLNTAFARDPAVVTIPAGKVLEEPLFVFENAQGEGAFANQQLVVKAGANAVAKIVIVFDADEDVLINQRMQVFCDENSEVEVYFVQMRAQQARVINYLEVYQQKNSRFNGFTLTTSCTLARNNLNIILNGDGAESHLYGLYEIDGQEHVDNRTVMDHAVPNCFSNELYKGILRDKSEAVFNGKIIVRPDAQKTNAFQHNATLILSDDATINAKPQLEIFADDVKCSHGATSGQLDEEHMFYLRQRGLGKEDAKALLTYAFASQIVEKISVPELSEYMEQELRGRLLM